MTGRIPKGTVRRHAFAAAAVIRLMFVLVLWAVLPTIALSKPRDLFCYVPSDDAWASLSSHAAQIPILAPQLFIIDETGKFPV